MSDITLARKAVIARIVEGDGKAAQAQRRAAFENTELSDPRKTLVYKVAQRAHLVTDDDVGAARATGLTEDQVFEIVVCAAVGEANRQYDTACAALEAATHEG
jgi:hypothetical protein